jgi:hypothetical protein
MAACRIAMRGSDRAAKSKRASSDMNRCLFDYVLAAAQQNRSLDASGGGACFATSLVRRRVFLFAPPRQL